MVLMGKLPCVSDGGRQSRSEVVQPISPQHLDSQEYKSISASYL
jgi:hypothetical protein